MRSPSVMRPPFVPLALLVLLVLLVLSAGCESRRAGAAIEESGRSPIVAVHVTTGDQRRLLARDADLVLESRDADSALPVVVVDPERRYQSVVGWGAAVTDAAAHLIQSTLTPAQREALLQELFGRAPGRGIGLSFVRVPIGASDFSPRHYSFDDMPPGASDPSLARFSIDADRAEKIPVLQRALAINPQLVIVGSPWSAPGWMKTSGSLIGGTLTREHYPAFAEYLRRWVAEYERAGVPIFAVTLQNEPHHEPDDYPGMRLEPAARATLIRDHLGPLLARHGMTTRLWEWDHNWDEPESPLAVLGDSGARRWVAGVAWHCYGGDVAAQAAVHDRYPEVESWFTECSGGEWAPVWSDNLSWNVSTLVIGTARAWTRGVALWNLALDEQHGPHLGGCTNCRGVVTIHAATGEVVRNPEYYALAHASRFARPGATRIASSAPAGLETVAFRNADDGAIALIVLNAAAEPRPLAVREGARTFAYTMPARAVATFTWR